MSFYYEQNSNIFEGKIFVIYVGWTSLLFSRSIVSNSLWPHGLQHTRLPFPSPSPGVCSNSCPLSQWCHRTISYSIVSSSCFQSFPALGSFLLSQSIGAAASASVPPVNIQDWFPLGLTDLISLQSKGMGLESSNIDLEQSTPK